MDIIINNPVITLVLLLIIVILIKFSKKFLKYVFIIAIGSLLFFALAGCSNGNLDLESNMENIEENTITRIQDLPFIKNSEIDIEKSLILGEGKSWSGQLFVKIPEPKPEVFNFYIRNIGDFGWKEQTTIRGETSVLNYVGENNPYESLPRMVMMTYQMPESITQITNMGEFKEFDLNEFFKAEGKEEKAKFKYENNVQQWLDLIRGSGFNNIYTNLKLGENKPALPFADSRLINLLNHTLR